MKRNISLPVILLLCMLSACGSDDEAATPPVPSGNTTPAQTPATTVPAATAGKPSSPAPSGIALNPAHGQPGHRCDIAVGAPLNSPPAPVNSNAATNQPVPAPAPLPVNASANDLSPSKGVINNGVSATPGLNPAHGQPGHRCDIAVGAPLNSKPLKQ